MKLKTKVKIAKTVRKAANSVGISDKTLAKGGLKVGEYVAEQKVDELKKATKEKLSEIL
ncbi:MULTISPECIES: hypothetical protein [Flammeovirga]|uniref:Uncharacterized protein n=1 Tax=Flammeovirga agarivorans TaxID=2726742 RepID=A0A7X8SK55_9BACT|nr:MULTISPECIES: hypothetical protein [Flammeovirga]NLR91740.1 hypothetical protein [Flammeovirga agarivorans]